ncbi:MAG: hypothetical protein AB1566_15040 [Chloroflexota bacterium]
MRSTRERMIRRMMTQVECAVCGHRYRAEDIRFLARHNQAWFFAVVCGRCRTHGLVTVFMQKGLPHVEITSQELERFQALPPLGADDVIDMHETLERFDGDFAQRFRRRAKDKA